MLYGSGDRACPRILTVSYQHLSRQQPRGFRTNGIITVSLSIPPDLWSPSTFSGVCLSEISFIFSPTCGFRSTFFFTRTIDPLHFVKYDVAQVIGVGKNGSYFRIVINSTLVALGVLTVQAPFCGADKTLGTVYYCNVQTQGKVRFLITMRSRLPRTGRVV